jgi:hypothetical protein
VVASAPENYDEIRSEKATRAVAPLIALPLPEVIPYKTTKAQDGRPQLTITLPAGCSDERIAEGMRLFSRAVNGEHLTLAEPQKRELLLSRLRYSKSQDVPEKNLFGFLMLALKECALTGREDEIIHSHMLEFEVLVDRNYMKASRAGYKFRLYGERTHAGDVTKMFEYFKATDEIGRRKSALEIVIYMQATWEKANKDGSGLLYAVLEGLIRELRDKLLMHLDSYLQLDASAVSSTFATSTPRKIKQ